MKQLLIVVLLIFSSVVKAQSDRPVVSIAGQWHIRLDRSETGEAEKWYTQKLTEPIQLPGSCEQHGYGDKPQKSETNRLTHVRTYVGKAWYQRQIEIPAAWKGKRVELFLERCQWESTVWLDDHKTGLRNSLSAPHIYDLGILEPGTHTLTVCVDNSYKVPIGTWSHAITEDTQGQWNGIIGRLEIRATDPVWIENADIYPGQLKVRIGNQTGRTVSVKVQGAPVSVPDGGTEVNLPFQHTGEPWSDLSPSLHDLDITLKSRAYNDRYRIRYGMRTLEAENRQFLLNGRPVLVRGAVDECVYPLTGYPPMDKPEWLRIFGICREYGFNYMRFHSWCPPAAAFEAADELGFLLQIELPFWSMKAPHYGKDAARDAYLKKELETILETYGNHPSFAFMAMGNESSGPLEELVEHGRSLDPRRLYRCENGFTREKGDFYETGMRGVVGPRTNWDRWTMSGWIVSHKGVEPTFSTIDVPVLAHEVGQWGVYPDLNQEAKFTGTLRADYLSRYRSMLEENHLLDQAADFARASGKLSLLLYKDEIEAGMRTYPFGGFQVLEARDYPGQGVALVGWLDAFWDSKGLIEPERFREFCDTTVCLLETDKRIWTTRDKFIASTLVAHYGSIPLEAGPELSIADENGNELYRVPLQPALIPPGKVTATGRVNIPLHNLPAPARLIVTLSTAGKSNSWNIWVYPDEETQEPEGVNVVYAFDDRTREMLARGETVVLFSSPTEGVVDVPRGMLVPDSVRELKPVSPGRSALPGSFMPVFWNLRLFNQIGTMGILCDPAHPALAGFPTESHSDWQWADLLGIHSAAESFRRAGASLPYYQQLFHDVGDVAGRSKAFILNETPPAFRPIVQVIDNYERNARLGVIFETRVGPGKLLVCGMDLDTDSARRPAARQLKKSLLDYAAGDRFNPRHELTMDLLERLLTYP